MDSRLVFLRPLGLRLVLISFNAALAATIEMRVTDVTLGTSVTITDNQAGFDFNAAIGQITFIGTVGAFNTNVQTGTGSDVLGNGILDLTFNAGSLTGTTDVLKIEFSQIGTTPSFPGWFGMINGNWSVGGGTVEYQMFESNTNAYFATTNQIGTNLIFNTTGFGGSTGGGVVGVTAPYSITQVLTITPNGTPRSRIVAMTFCEPRSWTRVLSS